MGAACHKQQGLVSARRGAEMWVSVSAGLMGASLEDLSSP